MAKSSTSFRNGSSAGRLLRQLLVVPGRGGVGGQRQHVGQVDAGIAAGLIDVGGEVEYLREQDHAVQVDALAVLQNVGEDRGARGAVALAEDVLGRVPAVVLGDEARNEAGKGVGVFVHAPEGLPASLPTRRPKPVPGMSMKTRSLVSSREYGVVDQLVRRGGQVLIAIGDYVLGAERAHVQPDGRAARTAVVEEGDGPVFSLRVLLEVGHVKDARNRGCVLRLFGFGDGELAAGLRLSVHAELRILHVGGAHGQRAGDRGVGNVLAAHIDRPLRRDFGGGAFSAALSLGFVSGLVSGRSWLREYRPRPESVAVAKVRLRTRQPP
jgi:hypothetical protein